MTKIQIGWKAKSESGYWYLYEYTTAHINPIVENNRWKHPLGVLWIPDHPEQPEIPWDKSLKPVYIEV